MRKWLSSVLLTSVAATCASGGIHTLRPAAPADASAPPVLWRDPGPIASLDLFWGSGHKSRTPQGPFRFVEEETSGKNPKITVTDARGDTWDVKFGWEVHAEVAANRIVWALGYNVEEQYFVREGSVSGANRLGRAADHVRPDGLFRDARFRWRNPSAPRTHEDWTLAKNPFTGSKEMSGLHILMTLLNNWDIDGPRNNKVVRAVLPDGGIERRFLVADLGATFGRMGGKLSGHTKWTLADFQKERFIRRVSGGMVDLAYRGLDGEIDRVPLDHARWFAAMASQLSLAQLRRAFEAAGAAPHEVDGYSTKVSEKIAALQRAVNQRI